MQIIRNRVLEKMSRKSMSVAVFLFVKIQIAVVVGTKIDWLFLGLYVRTELNSTAEMRNALETEGTPPSSRCSQEQSD